MHYSQFRALELLGYQAVSVGCFEDDVQVVFTTGLAHSIKPSFVEYVRATMIAGK